MVGALKRRARAAVLILRSRTPLLQAELRQSKWVLVAREVRLTLLVAMAPIRGSALMVVGLRQRPRLRAFWRRRVQARQVKLERPVVLPVAASARSRTLAVPVVLFRIVHGLEVGLAAPLVRMVRVLMEVAKPAALWVVAAVVAQVAALRAVP